MFDKFFLVAYTILDFRLSSLPRSHFRVGSALAPQRRRGAEKSKSMQHKGIYLQDLRNALEYEKGKPKSDEKTLEGCNTCIDAYIKHYGVSKKSVLK